MSARIRKERKAYYDVLEKTQKNTRGKGGIDITLWLEWFLGCLERAVDATEMTLADVFRKAHFWELHLENSEGNLTSSKWAQITKCSQDTALRDILELVEKGILLKDSAGGRSTRYLLKAF